jgi:hypothetical protein
MTFFHSVYDSIYFNYLSFGTLLSFIFTFLLGIYLVTLPGKSKSTLHLGIGFFFTGNTATVTDSNINVAATSISPFR